MKYFVANTLYGAGCEQKRGADLELCLFLMFVVSKYLRIHVFLDLK